jgi:hypothetical protein
MYNLFNDVIGNADYISLNGRMIVNYELEKIWREGLYTILRYYPDILLAENHEKPQSG